ncbi:hypothetical protein Hdeb2414_s0002g00060551 [Helianthus debilis subsp. tardiflorus]
MIYGNKLVADLFFIDFEFFLFVFHCGFYMRMVMKNCSIILGDEDFKELWLKEVKLAGL